MKIRFFGPAEAELLDAISFYNTQSEGLGYEFAAEVNKTIQRIIQYPEAWTKLSKRTRRCRTKGGEGGVRSPFFSQRKGHTVNFRFIYL